MGTGCKCDTMKWLLNVQLGNSGRTRASTRRAGASQLTPAEEGEMDDQNRAGHQRCASRMKSGLVMTTTCKMKKKERKKMTMITMYIFQGSETAWHPAPALSNTKHKKDGQGTAGTQRHRQKAAHLTNATEGSFMAVCAVVKDQPDRIGQPGGMEEKPTTKQSAHLLMVPGNLAYLLTLLQHQFKGKPYMERGELEAAVLTAQTSTPS
ncbi:hypothetical protein ABBQ38_011861 [Trebouxia sp. C0009 RCD-2024]